MNDEQLLRYSRHLLLEEIDIAGQEKLLASRILIVGVGGLGCAAAPYLAAAGVGKLTLLDKDTVELSNLQRQIMHNLSTVGKSKVASGKQFLQAINPSIEIIPLFDEATDIVLSKLIPQMDAVLDCTDNFATRHLINAHCVKYQVPLIAGSALRFDGQISVFDPRHANSPCYACIFPPNEPFTEVSCASMGIFSPLVGMIGSLQAAQALQILLGFGEPLVGRMLLCDALNTQMTGIQIQRDPQCSVCGKATS